MEFRSAITSLTLIAVSATGLFAQNNDPRPWRTVAETANNESVQLAQNTPPPVPYNDPRPAPMPASPGQLTIRPGTWITVRVNQVLSSDRNQQGDSFFGTLAEPLIVDGVVVARRGQTVMGRVSAANKAGRTEGKSSLGLQLISMTLVDGQQIPLQSEVIDRQGTSSVGNDVGTVATTTALGAMIGAAADWGRGAAIGAGAGAAAGIAGVLLTRGHPTVVYPETALTFQVQAPVSINTDHSAQAFRYAESQQDYGQDMSNGERNNAPRYARSEQLAPLPYYYGPSYYSPYWGNSGFSFYFGSRYPRYYSRGRGFRR